MTATLNSKRLRKSRAYRRMADAAFKAGNDTLGRYYTGMADAYDAKAKGV
jgi:hypothetical protein